MHWHLWEAVADQVDETRVGHDQRIWFECDDGCHVVEISFKLGVMRRDVAHNIKRLFLSVGFINAFLQRIQSAELVVAHT